MKFSLFKDVRLKYAILNNDFKSVDKLLKDSTPPDFHIEHKTTVMFALEKGYFNIASSLINNGANVLETDKDNYSSLHYAIINPDTPFFIIASLIYHGADVNCSSFIGRTPIHIACINGNLPIMQYLLSRGANINAKDMFGNTLMHMACMNNHTDMVQFLIQNNLSLYEKNNSGVYAISLLDEANRNSMLVYSYFKKRNVISPIRTISLTAPKAPLNHTLRKKSLEIDNSTTIKNSTQYGLSELMYFACKKGDVQHVEYLIDMGVDINATDFLGNNILIHIANKNNDVNMLQMLINHGIHLYEINYARKTQLELLSTKMRQKLNLNKAPDATSSTDLDSDDELDLPSSSTSSPNNEKSHKRNDPDPNLPI